MQFIIDMQTARQGTGLLTQVLALRLRRSVDLRVVIP